MLKSGLLSSSFSDRMTLADHMQIFLVMETPQGSDWMPIMPHRFQWPQASVGNVTWADEDL